MSKTIDMSTTTHHGLDKIARYGWKVMDEPGEFRLLHKEVLQVHPSYQRDLIPSKVTEFCSSWSWIALGALVVGERNGEFWVIDGQHRLLAAKRRSDINTLPCMVFVTDGIKEEALAFLKLNTGRKPVTAFAKQKALVTSGDETAVFVSKVCDELGIRVMKASTSPATLVCVAWCNKRAAENRDEFKRVLALVAEICSRDNIPIPEKVLEGIWHLNQKCGDGLNDKRLVRRIREKGGRALLDAAIRASSYFAAGGGRVWANGILDELNKGLQRKFLMSKEST